MTYFDIKSLKEKRRNVFDGMEAILEKCRTEDREATDSERTEFDAREAEFVKLTADIERMERQEARSAARTEVAETRGVSRDEHDTEEKRYERAYVNWFKRGLMGLDGEQRTTLDSGHGLSTAPNSSGISAGSVGYNGGYLVPQGYWHNLQIALKEYGGILQYCNILTTDSGNPMPWPTVDPTGVVGSYLTEQNQLGFGGDSNGTDYQFGQGMLNAWTIVSGVILASLQLIEDSAFNVDSFVSDRIGEAIGRKIGAELHSGTGSTAFLGVETALVAKGRGSTYGTGGIYKSGTATTFSATAGGNAFTLQGGTSAQAKLANALIGFDDIEGMKITVDPAYRNSGRCRWVMNDATGAMLRTITDAYGHPLWQPSVQPGMPDMISGFPVTIDQNTSSVSTSASTAGGLLFGDFQTAMIVRQVNGAHTMRLTERYADYLQVGYLGYVRADARSNDLRAAAYYSTNAT
jgi:HK97 family phage major capsid protein